MHEAVIGSDRAAIAVRAEAARGGERRRRMTVVDDSPEFVSLVTDLFEDRFEVCVPNDGSIEAIAVTEPDVLIADLHGGEAGRLTGCELVSRARERPDLGSVPIIVCTADRIGLAGTGDHLRRYADVHIVEKPFALDVLESLVERLVRDTGASGVGRR